MVDFKKLREQRYAALSETEKEKFNQFKTAIKENTFYSTKTMLEYDRGGTERECDVLLRYRVYKEGNTIKVGNRLILSFNQCEYYFDSDFVKYIRGRMNEDKNSRFCIDFGGEVYVKHDEMLRILSESEKIKNIKKNN